MRQQNNKKLAGGKRTQQTLQNVGKVFVASFSGRQFKLCKGFSPPPVFCDKSLLCRTGISFENLPMPHPRKISFIPLTFPSTCGIIMKTKSLRAIQRDRQGFWKYAQRGEPFCAKRIAEPCRGGFFFIAQQGERHEVCVEGRNRLYGWKVGNARFSR